MTTHQDREADAAQRLLDAVERLTGGRAGELHQRDTGAVYTRMAELIERAADERGKLKARVEQAERERDDAVRFGNDAISRYNMLRDDVERLVQAVNAGQLRRIIPMQPYDRDLPDEEASDGE